MPENRKQRGIHVRNSIGRQTHCGHACSAVNQCWVQSSVGVPGAPAALCCVRTPQPSSSDYFVKEGRASDGGCAPLLPRPQPLDHTRWIAAHLRGT